MKATHTPKPWHAEQNPLDPNCIVIRSADGFAIASAWNLGGLQIPIAANARLLSSAPDLLAACECAMPMLNLLAAKMNSPPEVIDTIRIVIDAIAKANGE